MGEEKRPDAKELRIVEGSSLIFRLVNPKDFVATLPKGQRVLASALPNHDCKPSPSNYGASAFVKELLIGGLTDLYNACERWKTYRVSEVAVRDVIAVEGVQVRLSPQDCREFPTVEHAHASIIGVTRQNRPALLRLIEAHILD